MTVKQQRGANRVEANEEESSVPAPNSLDGSADGSTRRLDAATTAAPMAAHEKIYGRKAALATLRALKI